MNEIPEHLKPFNGDGRAYNRARFINYCKTHGYRHCLCFSPKMGNHWALISNGCGQKEAYVCENCGLAILETIQ